MNVQIKRLTPKLAQDFLDFFDNVAFSDNPDWAECYCCFYYFGDEELRERTGAMNRSYAEKAIGRGQMSGFLAYIDGEPVGWVNANDKGAFARLEQGNEVIARQETQNGKLDESLAQLAELRSVLIEGFRLNR